MKHAAAIHFLEKSYKRVEATIDLSSSPQDRDQLIACRDSLKDSIETLRALQWVEQRASEIRSKKDV